MKATVFFFLLLAVTLALASPASGGPSAGSDKPDGPRNPDYVPANQSPSYKGLPTPAPFDEASKQAHAKREEEHEPQVAEDPEVDSQTLEPSPPPKDPHHKRQEADEGRHRFEHQQDESADQKRRPSSDDSAYKGGNEKRRPSSDNPSYKDNNKRRPSSDDPSYNNGAEAPKAKREEDSSDEGRHRFEDHPPAAKRQNEEDLKFNTNVKRDDADYSNRNRGGDHFEKRDKFSTDVKRRGVPPNAREQEETEDTDARKRDEDEDFYAGRNRQQDGSDESFSARNRQQEPSDEEEAKRDISPRQEEEEPIGTDVRKRDDADYSNRNRGGDHFEKRDKFRTDVKRDEAVAPHRRPDANGRRAEVPFYRPRATVEEIGA